MKRKTLDKATRLVDEGRIQELPASGGGVRHWLVESSNYDPAALIHFADEGPTHHYVTTRADYARCSCRAGIYAMRHGATPACAHSVSALWMARQKKS